MSLAPGGHAVEAASPSLKSSQLGGYIALEAVDSAEPYSRCWRVQGKEDDTQHVLCELRWIKCHDSMLYCRPAS